MTLRKGMFAALALLVVLVFVPDAHAQTDNQDPGTSDPCFDAGSAWEDCWTQTGGYKGPTTYTCYALASNKQRCRSCVDQYDDWGQPTGYKVCGYVAQDAACNCKLGTKPADCTNDGICSYFQ